MLAKIVVMAVAVAWRMEEDLSTSNIPVAQRRNSRIPPSLSTLRTKVRVETALRRRAKSLRVHE